MKYNEKDIRYAIEVEGKSISKVAKELGKNVGQLSKFCKDNGIHSKYSCKKKIMPLEEIKEKYLAGVSFYKLGKEYGRPASLVKKHLLIKYPNLKIRSMDEAKRPPELNDPEKLHCLMQNMSLTKIGKLLNVKTNTVCEAVKRLNLKEYVNRQEVIIDKKTLIEMYIDHNLSTTKIADAYNTWPQTIIRLLTKHNIKIKPPGGVPRDSKYHQLNDIDWLKINYVDENLSANKISDVVGCSTGMVLYHLRKFGIKIRQKKEVYKKLRREQAKSNVVTTKWGKFAVHSKQEQLFIESIPGNAKSVKREPVTLEYNGAHYTPDFEVDGDLIEIKPIEYAKYPGVDRQKFIKQKCIANANNLNIKTWYKGSYYDVEPINDLDKYFSLNWKLMFNSPDEVYEFYYKCGFIPLKYWKDDLLKALNCIDVPDQHKMSATYQNIRVTDFLKHFSPHFWDSKFKGYNAPSDVFKFGNRIILKDAISEVWKSKLKCNVYGLMAKISKNYKDVSTVSLFKPWIARSLYRKYLPDGGTLLDPCMGWGGRLLGTLDLDIAYIGYDFNPKAVKSNKDISNFVGSRWLTTPSINFGDSSKVCFPKSDMIFTSPPYDDTEYYYGLEEQCFDTNPIYRNIFKANTKIIALNIPLRHEEQVKKIADAYEWKLMEVEKMNTRNRIRRKKSYEPILIFKKTQ